MCPTTAEGRDGRKAGRKRKTEWAGRSGLGGWDWDGEAGRVGLKVGAGRWVREGGATRGAERVELGRCD